MYRCTCIAKYDFKALTHIKQKSLDADLHLKARKLLVCLIYCFPSQSTAMVMSGR